MSDKITICECFARDGLQHEEDIIPTATKIELIQAFTDAGFQRVEATSYSHPQHIPAFKDASDVLRGIQKSVNTHYKATCPNVFAVRRAIDDLEQGAGATELSFLYSASESHSQKNLKASREEQWNKIIEMTQVASGKFRLIGVISVAFGCPFEGKIKTEEVIADIKRFTELGITHVTLGDTTGLATPNTVKDMFNKVFDNVPEVTPIAHFHNTRGSALANCIAALDAGCRYFDSSMGGIGGHPAQIKYGSGFTGNVPTEDLVNLLESMGFDTGLDLEAVLSASCLCEKALGRELHSMVARTGFGILSGN